MTLATRLIEISSKLNRVKSLASNETIQAAEQLLQQEVEALQNKLTTLKERVRQEEMRFGILQYDTFNRSNLKSDSSAVNAQPQSNTNPIPTEPVKTASTMLTSPTPVAVKPKQTPAKAKATPKGDSKKPAANLPVDVGRLDMRVGRILEVSIHPEADNSFVEKVDLGEEQPRTVVSCLVKYVSVEAMQNRVGIFMCNLKPLSVRGVVSEAMLMCASSVETGRVEPLVLDADDVVLGEPVVVPGYEHNPDSQLNPKKKILEQVKPDLKVDQSGLATYKGTRWMLKNRPDVTIKSSTLTDVAIA